MMIESDNTVRLQKYLARAGVASRRKCEELITAGRVSVNGAVVTELGTKVDPDHDEIAFDGVPVTMAPDEKPVVVMLNKPKGYLTAMSDARTDDVVSALVPTDRYKGLFPIGRLDRDTTGLLLFTTDGELGHWLAHPSHGVIKRYVALIEGALSEDDVRALEGGVELNDGMTSPATCAILRTNADGTQLVELAIHEGRKRQVRRMLSHVGHEVIELERIAFGPLRLGDLAPGAWRLLEDAELSQLYASCGPQYVYN